MLPILFFLLIIIGGIAAGLIGSLTGLGGAVILTPLLVLGFGIPIYYAAGASLIASIATSSGAASAYVKDKITNIKIGMSLEVGTTIGAIVGVLIATQIYKAKDLSVIFILFGVVLIFSIYPSMKKLMRKKKSINIKPDKTTKLFQLNGSYYDEQLKKRIKYYGVRWWYSELIMLFAGLISGLLGVGSGALKVLSLDDMMKLPPKVSAATSDFMIGVTAAAGTAIYWEFGYMQPFIAGAAAIGVLTGSYFGSKFLNKEKNNFVRELFVIVILILGVQMILRGIGVI
ncbi:MAG: sulfite exporter TauE/SafE family protein [Candidatus Micrarchaeia archaeon]